VVAGAPSKNQQRPKISGQEIRLACSGVPRKVFDDAQGRTFNVFRALLEERGVAITAAPRAIPWKPRDSIVTANRKKPRA
jgi:hypothetical protein